MAKNRASLQYVWFFHVSVCLIFFGEMACSDNRSADLVETTPINPPGTVYVVKAGPDGMTLDDPRWESISSQSLTLDEQRIADDQRVVQPGSFRIAYDHRAIYLRVDFNDDDVVSDGAIGTNRLFRAGDVAEWFIGTPSTADGRPGRYYELHIAPDQRRAAFRIDRPGKIKQIEPPGFSLEVSIDATLNNVSDRDVGWSAMFILPWETLEQLDASLAFSPSSPPTLTMLVGRQNYGQHLLATDDGRSIPERTMWPTQRKTTFHVRRDHAPLVFLD